MARRPASSTFFGSWPLASLAGACLAACGSAGAPADTRTFADPEDPSYSAGFDEPIDPRVSTSRGARGGVVVLWPRVVPAEDSETVRIQARVLQEHLADVARRVVAPEQLDVRPEPERVCPKNGCEAVSLGAVLVHQGQGCAAVATVGRSGPSAVRLVPWAGAQAGTEELPFREPPESHLDIGDLVPCADLEAALGEAEGRIEAVLLELVQSSS